MPIYTYKCPKCNWSGDVFVMRERDKDSQECEQPQCTSVNNKTHLIRDEVSLSARMSHQWEEFRKK